MPRYLDVHPVGNLSEETLKNLQQSPKDEFGITHANIIYNEKEDTCYCLLDATNREAVERHHHKARINCDWITEVKSTA